MAFIFCKDNKCWQEWNIGFFVYCRREYTMRGALWKQEYGTDGVYTHTHICLEGQQGRNWYGEKEEWKWCEKSACGVCLCACVCDIIQIPLLSIVSPNFKSSSQEDVCTPICIVAPFTILSKFYRFSECLHLTKQSLLVRIWKPGHIWKHAEAFLVNASRTQTYFHKMFSLSLLLFGKCCWNRDVH